MALAFEFTEKRRVAALANLKKAREAHLAGRVPRPARPPNLKHGSYARDLRQSVILLGEDVGEYDAHLDRFAKVFTPSTDRERTIVRRIAEAAWRLIRTYRARGNAQTRKLRQVLMKVAPHAPLHPVQVQRLAIHLVSAISDEGCLLQYMSRLRNQFERLVRLLLVERTGSDQGFRVHTHFKLSPYDLQAPFE